MQDIIEINSLKEFLDLAKEGQQMNKEEQALRVHIRKKISKMYSENQKKEYELRKVIRSLLKEGDISDVHPHRSTAINTLEDVLKKAIPTLRTDYKRLTTDASQRQSFRAHILKAMQDSVAPAMNNAKYGEGGALLSEPTNLEADEVADEAGEDLADTEEEGGLEDELAALEEADIQIDLTDKEDDEKKLNVEPDEEPDEKSDFGGGLEGMDETGRNMAYTTFRKISQYILDAFDMLANTKDKEVFIDYLLTNTKLYFDKFESELQKTVDEPDSPEA